MNLEFNFQAVNETYKLRLCSSVSSARRTVPLRIVRRAFFLINKFKKYEALNVELERSQTETTLSEREIHATPSVCAEAVLSQSAPADVTNHVTSGPEGRCVVPERSESFVQDVCNVQ